MVPLSGGVCGGGLGGLTVDLCLALVPTLVLQLDPLVPGVPALCPMLVPGPGLVVEVQPRVQFGSTVCGLCTWAGLGPLVLLPRIWLWW